MSYPSSFPFRIFPTDNSSSYYVSTRVGHRPSTFACIRSVPFVFRQYRPRLHTHRSYTSSNTSVHIGTYLNYFTIKQFIPPRATIPNPDFVYHLPPLAVINSYTDTRTPNNWVDFDHCISRCTPERDIPALTRPHHNDEPPGLLLHA